MHRRHQFLTLVLSSALALCCSAANAADDSGKRLYLLKCAKCHKLYDPVLYDDETWASWMGKMQKKSRLGDEDFRRVLDYVETLRKK